MRSVIGALFHALPGMGSIVAVLALIFYIASVMATKLFGAAFPDWFGSIGASMYSLFQVMTLESWSMGIVRPVMEAFPYAWIFFVSYILISTFTMLNLFIAVVVNAMQAEHAREVEAAQGQDASAMAAPETALHAELRALREEVRALRAALSPHANITPNASEGAR